MALAPPSSVKGAWAFHPQAHGSSLGWKVPAGCHFPAPFSCFWLGDVDINRSKLPRSACVLWELYTYQIL